MFTLSVLQGLTDATADLNGDKVVSITELADYVSQSVREKTSGLQNPTFRRENLEFDYAFLSPDVVVLGQEETDFVKIVPVVNQAGQGNLGNQSSNASTETEASQKEVEPKETQKNQKEESKKKEVKNEEPKNNQDEQLSTGLGSGDVYSFHLLKYGIVGAEYEHMVSDHFGVNVGAGALSLMVGAKYHFQPDITSSSIGINMGYKLSYILLAGNDGPHTFTIAPYYEYRSSGWFTFSAGLGVSLYKYTDSYTYNGHYYEDKYTDALPILYVGVGMYFQR